MRPLFIIIIVLISKTCLAQFNHIGGQMDSNMFNDSTTKSLIIIDTINRYIWNNDEWQKCSRDSFIYTNDARLFTKTRDSLFNESGIYIQIIKDSMLYTSLGFLDEWFTIYNMDSHRRYKYYYNENGLVDTKELYVPYLIYNTWYYYNSDLTLNYWVGAYTPSPNFSSQVTKDTMVYNNSLLEEKILWIDHEWLNGWTIYYRYFYIYDEDNRLVSEEYIKEFDTQGYEGRLKLFFYNSGNLSSQENFIQDQDSNWVVDWRFNYTYDENNILIERIKQSWNTQQVKWINAFKEIYHSRLSLSSINEVQMSNVKIYPNPSNDMINILSTDGRNIEGVTLCSIQGEKLGIFDQKSNYMLLDLNRYPKGMYLLVIQIEDNIVVKKVVLN